MFIFLARSAGAGRIPWYFAPGGGVLRVDYLGTTSGQYRASLQRIGWCCHIGTGGGVKMLRVHFLARWFYGLSWWLDVELHMRQQL